MMVTRALLVKPAEAAAAPAIGLRWQRLLRGRPGRAESIRRQSTANVVTSAWTRHIFIGTAPARGTRVDLGY